MGIAARTCRVSCLMLNAYVGLGGGRTIGLQPRKTEIPDRGRAFVGSSGASWSLHYVQGDATEAVSVILGGFVARPANAGGIDGRNRIASTQTCRPTALNEADRRSMCTGYVPLAGWRMPGIVFELTKLDARRARPCVRTHPVAGRLRGT